LLTSSESFLAKLKKYIARLQLLDHGLLAESQIISNMTPKIRSGGAAGADADDDAEESLPAETVEQFSARIDKTVKQFIDRSMSPDEGVADVGSTEDKPDLDQRIHTSGRDNYKDGLVYAERRELLHEFGRKAYMKCSHCNA
jgi:DNA-directed RNA polymerase I subunit RPA1